MSPLILAIAIVLGVAVVGGLIHYFRTRAQFRGYEEIDLDVREIGKSLGGEIFRDGNDLVISGTYRAFPVIVRFSYDENTPGLNIRMNAPASFTLSVVPKGARATEGRVLVRTNDTFDARFVTRSDQPTQAKMLLSSKPVQTNLEKLCCSQKTFFTITSGLLEQSELVIPSGYVGRHVLDHLAQLRVLAEATRSMPGAEKVRVEPLRRERRLAMRALLAAGVVAAVFAVAAAVQTPRQAIQAEAAAIPEGVPAAAAALIPNLTDWRLTGAVDFDNDAATWARNNGQPPTGYLPANFSGKEDSPSDGAYIFVNSSGDHRVVLLSGNKRIWDVSMPQLAAAVRIPKALLPAVDWAGKTRPAADGDGLLLVRDAADPRSGTIVFLANGEPASAAVVNYQRVRLE
jgi:hypothetical protein